jgi:hypothetical protein
MGIDVATYLFKVKIIIDTLINRSTSNMGIDTNPDANPDTNPGAQLWTTMDGLAEIGPNIWSRKTTMDRCGQMEAHSTTVAYRFDSCPTCPRILNLCGLLPHGPSTVCVP